MDKVIDMIRSAMKYKWSGEFTIRFYMGAIKSTKISTSLNIDSRFDQDKFIKNFKGN